MNERRTFIAMLERAGIGHGTRRDYHPDGESVQVEHPDEEGDGFHVTDWMFDAAGKLVSVEHYEGEVT